MLQIQLLSQDIFPLLRYLDQFSAETLIFHPGWCSCLPYDYSNSWLSIFIATLWAPTLTLQFRRLYSWECFLTKSFSINSYNFISVQSQAACTHEIVQNRLLVKVPAYMTKKIQTQEFEIDFFKIASYSFGGITVWLCSKPQKFSGFEI